MQNDLRAPAQLGDQPLIIQVRLFAERVVSEVAVLGQHHFTV